MPENRCGDWSERTGATRLLFVETSATHPFAVTELMMPVLPVVRVANVDEAIELAVKLEGGCHHTAAMHSRNIENMNRMQTPLIPASSLRTDRALPVLDWAVKAGPR